MSLSFYQIVLLFFIKNRCIVLHSVNNFNKTDREIMNQEGHEKGTKYFIENICHQFPDLKMPSNLE